MIAANELRYGVNVIGKGLNEGRVLTFNSLHRTDNTIAFFQNSELGEHLKDLDAIPLTEEWLLKFGFEKDRDEGGPYWYLKDDKFVFGRQRNGFFIHDIRTIRNPNMKGLSHFNLEYVHQLQNLYFALTGKELELKKDDWKEVTNRQGETFQFKPLPPD